MQATQAIASQQRHSNMLLDPKWLNKIESIVGSIDTIQPIMNGITNQTFKVAVGGSHFAVRINNKNAFDLGIDRDDETNSVQYAIDLGFHPDILFTDKELGIRITHWVEGKHPTTNTLSSHDIVNLAAVCAQIHSIKTNIPKLDLIEYQRNLLNKKDSQLHIHSAIQKCFKKIIPERTGEQLCHMDLSPGNLLINSGCWQVLDWEYAARCTPWMDLAFCSCAFQFTDQQEHCFMKSYSDNSAGSFPYSSEILHRYKLLAKYLGHLWAENRLRSMRSNDPSHGEVSGYKINLTALLAKLELLSE